MTWIVFGFLLLLESPAAASDIPSFESVRKNYTSSENLIQDRNGRPLHSFRQNTQYRRLAWTPLERISPAFVKAALRSEDQRFFEHSGVDWLAAVHAGWDRIRGEKLRGASTISMQWVAALAMDSKGRKSWNEKITQAILARRFEKEWTKNQILEAYFNHISFRGELQGVETASRSLFAKSAEGLNQEESLILAALIRSPQSKEFRVRERACELGRALEKDYDCGRLLSVSELSMRSVAQPVQWIPHLAKVLQNKNISATRSTVDLRLQESVVEILGRQLSRLKSLNVRDATALVVDNATGEILAYVGGVPGFSSAEYVDGILAPRQAGSTLKPFLYAHAFEKKILTPQSRVADLPTEFSVSGGVYRPENYDHSFQGEDITASEALASSLNVPAVKTLELVGVDSFFSKIQALHFKTEKNSDFFGPSLALGSLDVTLYDLVAAYRTLANDGRYSPLQLTLGAKSSYQTVFSKPVAFLLKDILSSRENRSLSFGFENILNSRIWTAVKTGTSKDMRDNWCVGFSQKYTVGVWVGNFSGAPMWNVSGMTGAAPAWSEIMNTLHAKIPSHSPKAPAGVTLYEGHYYIAGTEGSFEKNQNPQARIQQPLNGTLLARDPDIPTLFQKLFLESNLEPAAEIWKLNQHRLTPEQVQGGIPLPPAGDHTLELLSNTGKVLDSVQFIVRGN